MFDKTVFDLSLVVLSKMKKIKSMMNFYFFPQEINNRKMFGLFKTQNQLLLVIYFRNANLSNFFLTTRTKIHKLFLTAPK